MKMSNETYDILKWVAQILLPALGALYFGVAKAIKENLGGTYGVHREFQTNRI